MTTVAINGALPKDTAEVTFASPVLSATDNGVEQLLALKHPIGRQHCVAWNYKQLLPDEPAGWPILKII